jgi:hypothetical protein
MKTHEHSCEQGSRAHRIRRPAGQMAPAARTPQWTSRLRAVLLAGAATTLLAGNAAGQLPAKPLENLKIAPATSFTITAKAGEGGKMLPAGTVTVRSGTTQQFAIAPDSGWEVLSVTGCGGSRVVNVNGQPTYTTGRVVGPCNVLASFVRLAPRLTSFKINNGAAQTITRSVTISYTAATGPTYPAPTSYLLSMRSDFLGAQWKSIAGTTSGIAHELEPGPGTKTLYFRLRSAHGTSEVLSDSIDLAQRQAYTVTGREFYDLASQRGYFTRANFSEECVSCTLIPGPADGIAADLVVARASPLLPACGPYRGSPLCRFDFFAGGELRNGFVFKSIDAHIGAPECARPEATGPTPGGTSVNFRVEIRQMGAQCEYQLVSVVLEGPPNRSWREALGLKP